MTLQNMAPSARRAFLLTLVFVGLAVGLYLGAVEPAESSLAKSRQNIQALQERHRKMRSDLAEAPQVEQRLADVREKLAPYQDALLVPLLESTAMRAKSIIDPLALGAGLHELEYEALPPRTLPLATTRLPRQLYARQPIRITARGSYQAAVSFILRVEKELPLVILQAFSVAAQTSPNEQKIEMVLEWPIKGKVTRP